MLNFIYDIPTKVFFGKGQIENLADQIKPFGDKILLAYGGGSIKQNGIYDQATKILTDNNIKFWELSGIKSNPDVTFVREGVKLCKENDIQFILAVGGGSTIDCAKAIALGVHYDGDPRDMFVVKKPGENRAAPDADIILPIGTILTLSATGSEMNPGMVISNHETQQKFSAGNNELYPKFSILDPEYTFSLPTNQTVAGIVDIMSHVFEQYFSQDECFLHYRLGEAILKTCIHYGPIAIKETDNYEARAELMWASSLALNRLIGYGKANDFASHMMEHELSAIYDIAHGDGLAILFPNRMEYVLGDGKEEKILNKFVEFAQNVRNISGTEDKLELAKQGIQATRDFWNQIGAPVTLQDVGIKNPDFDSIATKTTTSGDIGRFKNLNTDDVVEILKKCI